MNNKVPARLHKKEPITLVYNKSIVYITGTVFIIVLLAIVFSIGSENINFIFWSCV